MSQLKKINIQLQIWRQESNKKSGGFRTYSLQDIDTDASFLEMLDILNEILLKRGEDPISFDHDCREGICGTCGAVVNGDPHGPESLTTLCQLHMRKFKNNATIVIEPYRAKGLPVIKDLSVDRTAFDRIIQAGGYISVKTGSAQDGNNLPIRKFHADQAMESASCIGCAACVAACPNASAMLFLSAKVTHLSLLPQGEAEKSERVKALVKQADKEGFGACSNEYLCEAACPKGISVSNIAFTNKLFRKSQCA